MAEILVVDNNKCITELIREVLGSDGHNVATAQTGNQAEELFNSKDFDVAFIDIGLPDANGLSLISKIRQINPDTKAVVVSGKSDNDTIIKSFRAGAADYLLKPFDIDDLLRLAGSRRDIQPIDEILPYRKTTHNPKRLPRFLLKIAGHLVPPAMMAAALLIKFQLLPMPDIQKENAAMKIILQLASFICCYGFVISTAGYWVKFLNSKDSFGHKLISTTLAHILFLVVLYFANPYIDAREVLAMSWSASVAFYYIGQSSRISSFIRNLIAAREGRHRLIFGISSSDDLRKRGDNPDPTQKQQSAPDKGYATYMTKRLDVEQEVPARREDKVPLSV